MDAGINLIPKKNHILITPYHIASAKLKDLKVQLKDFLDKGCIRPSISPWGAPMLFVKTRMGL